MTTFDFAAAVFVIVGALSVLLGVIVLVNALALDWVDRRQRRRAHANVDARRQERIAQNGSHPRTGQVQAAPRLVPLADVLPFPLPDDGPERAA